MARAKDDDGEKEDELELMLLLGANEHRRRSRRPRPSVRPSARPLQQPDNGMDGHANGGRDDWLAALSRPIPQLEHYLSLNGTGRHHLSRRGQTRSRITPFASAPLSFGIQSNIRRYLCNDGRSDRRRPRPSCCGHTCSLGSARRHAFVSASLL